MRIYGDSESGNCYKLRLICALLDLDYEWVPIDILAGETRSETFLSLNPNGQIPVCVTDDGDVLTESNAILYYLARDSRYWPDELLAQTRVLQWQCFEQYSHEPSIAVARFIRHYQNLPAARQAEYEAKLKSGRRVLQLMEAHLENQDFFVGAAPTIADISLFAYTHVADEGGFDLAPLPAIRAWLERVAALPGFVPMRN